KSREANLEEEEDVETRPERCERHVAEDPLPDGAVLDVGLRHDPARRTLEDDELLRIGREARHDLHRARARPDDRDAFVAQIHVVPPARGMEARPVERPLEAWHGRTIELTERGDEDLGLVTLPRHRLELPHRASLVPRRRADLGA